MTLFSPLYYAFLGLFFSPVLLAADLDQVFDAQLASQRDAAAAQQQIDTLAEENDALLLEYRAVLQETENLQRHSAQVERLLAAQHNELSALEQQLAGLDATRQGLLPLLQDMLEALQRFVELDTPFLAEERRTRLRDLQAMMDQADVSLGEKYRRVLEAYQVEVAYGRSLDTYQGALGERIRLDAATEADGARTVDFLRLGRTALYYLSFDRREAAYWEQSSGTWKKLPAAFLPLLEQALRVARKQAAPQLLKLPLPVPERETQP